MMPINPPNSAKVLKFSLDPHTKKTWESVPVARPTSRGSRIARYSWTSNARPTPNMIYKTYTTPSYSRNKDRTRRDIICENHTT